jgi:WASH complex subunit CCDC53
LQQLSHLNDAADQRLYRLHSRLLTCKTNLLILEKKLASVNGLSDGLPTTSTIVTPVHQPGSIPSEEVEHDIRDAVADSRVINSEADQVPDEGEEPAGADQPDAESDAELQRFYKMLKVGVPLPAVRIKMISEGMDPDRLKV